MRRAGLSDPADLLSLLMFTDREIRASTLDVPLNEQGSAEVAGLTISLDRQEVGQDSRSAVQELEQSLNIPVVSIVTLEDLIEMLEEAGEYSEYLDPVTAYRERYGAST